MSIVLRALFSTRHFQQLFREGKLAYGYIYFYPIFLYLIAFPCLVLCFLQFYAPEVLKIYSPLLLYTVTYVGVIVVLLVSQLFLWYFTTIFNYQEQRYLYLTTKALYRFCNAFVLLAVISVVWYARIPEILIYIYIPLFLAIFFTFFIRFLSNISGTSRIHFFIYFCSLEILPYLLLIKLLITNL